MAKQVSPWDFSPADGHIPAVHGWGVHRSGSISSGDQLTGVVQSNEPETKKEKFEKLNEAYEVEKNNPVDRSGDWQRTEGWDSELVEEVLHHLSDL